MSDIRTIEVNVGIFQANDRQAQQVREINRRSHTYLVNVMASPGAGKTSVVLRTAQMLKGRYRIGVMEADIDSMVDAERIHDAGLRSIQIHTGGECAMDASMTRQAIEAFHTEDLDLLFLENVGNLVCPAEQDTGADLNVEILSYPEGDDKPLKYPLMFQVCQCILINKIDTARFFRFDQKKAEERIHALNPQAKIFPVSAKSGAGFAEWTSWLEGRMKDR